MFFYKELLLIFMTHRLPWKAENQERVLAPDATNNCCGSYFLGTVLCVNLLKPKKTNTWFIQIASLTVIDNSPHTNMNKEKFIFYQILRIKLNFVHKMFQAIKHLTRHSRNSLLYPDKGLRNVTVRFIIWRFHYKFCGLLESALIVLFLIMIKEGKGNLIKISFNILLILYGV